MGASEESSAAAAREGRRAHEPRAHLVGSIPLADSESVFRRVAGTLGGHLRRIPDGETGKRTRWNSWTAPTYERTPGLELMPSPPGSYTPWPQARLVIAADQLVLARIGFADAAIESYAKFASLKAADVIPPHVRFQVCLPSPIAPMIVLIEPGSRAAVEPAHLRQLHGEVAEILAAVPHDQLAIQWDVCQDVGIWEGFYPAYFEAPQAGVVERLRDCAQLIPQDVEVGFHLCYGDFGHKHFMTPTDLGVAAEMINQITAACARSIDYFHVPVPIDRDDPAYYAPLAALTLRPPTELYVGLIHFADGVEGAKRRIAAARRYITDFGVATECGFGRRAPETIEPLLALHADVAALVA